jgi:hypothetical protein
MPIYPDRFPFRFLAQHLAQNDDFQTDAKRVASIQAADFNALRRSFESFQGFLDSETLKGLIKTQFGAGPFSDDLSRIVLRLCKMFEQSDETLDKSLSLLRESVIEESKKLEASERRLFVDRIESLLKSPGFGLQLKAQQLSKATGSQLIDFQILCDVRPVFNSARSEVKGAIEVTLLRISIKDACENSSQLEVRLTEEQLVEIGEKVRLAQSKLATLTEMLTEKGVTIPRIPESNN